jgi:thiol-disulfide isomerase/thioredoxin
MLLATEEPSMSSLPLARRRVIRVFAVLGLGAAFAAAAAASAVEPPVVPPPFPSPRGKDWIGKPQSWDKLRGQVVLLDVWRYACSSCRATVPWVKDVRQRYADRGLVLVGVHTPAFTFEHERKNVESEVRRHGLSYSHLLDVDSAYMDALGTRGWPTVYLVDRCGRIRESEMGEVHLKDEAAQRLEGRIEALLAEPASACAAGSPAAAEARP